MTGCIHNVLIDIMCVCIAMGIMSMTIPMCRIQRPARPYERR